MHSFESIPGLHKRLKIRALSGRYDNPIPSRFLTTIDGLKIPALVGNEQGGAGKPSGSVGQKARPRLLQRPCCSFIIKEYDNC
jgi:hypothetical protein